MKRRNYKALHEFFPNFCYFLFGRSIYCPHRIGWKVLYHCRQSSGFILPAVTHLPAFTKEIVLYSCFLNFLPKFYRPVLKHPCPFLFTPPILRIHLHPRISIWSQSRGHACQSAPKITEIIKIMWYPEFYKHITGATVVESVFLWTQNNKPKEVNDVRRGCLLYEKAFTVKTHTHRGLSRTIINTGMNDFYSCTLKISPAARLQIVQQSSVRFNVARNFREEYSVDRVRHC